MRRLSFLITSWLMLTVPSVFGATIETSPVGYWKTIDDISGQPQSIVQISEDNNKELTAKVVKLFKDPAKRCTACEGDMQNMPIVGMTIMQGVKQDKNNQFEWVNGQIFDPSNGKKYHCNLKLLENGQKLRVRGFIGLPLFGRTQTWIKSDHIS